MKFFDERKHASLNPSFFTLPRIVLSLLLLGPSAESVWCQQPPILLWPNGAPGSQGKTAEEKIRINASGDHIISSIHRPSLTPYLASRENSNGAAVIVIPGGGHKELWMDHEGYRVAKWLSDHGITAFILKYRLAREDGSTYTIEGHSLPDVQRAIRLLRSRAPEWGIDPDRIGVIGFSAGGELAALAATRYDPGIPVSPDPIERQSSKPAFEALLYPAIPRDMKLSRDTPPAFLACGEKDRPEISQGLPELFLALERAGVSAELHIFSGVGHGFGIRDSSRPPVSDWPQLFRDWLAASGFLEQK
jgi:acetyl esterase/lipase